VFGASEFGAVAEVAAGGSVTVMLREAEVPVSFEVESLAVTLSVATGWPEPV